MELPPDEHGPRDAELGSSSTIFAVVDGVLRTHPLGHRVLPSVTRKVVMSLIAELGLPVREEAVSLAELGRATELFLCGTANNVMPAFELRRAVPAALAGGLTQLFELIRDAGASPA
ncbi:MAG TPA: aminotransferase class IV [Micromonosporaceae bacterium]